MPMYPSLILAFVIFAVSFAFNRWLERRAGRSLELPIPVPGLIVLLVILFNHFWLVRFSLAWWETFVATLAMFVVLKGFALWLSMHVGKKKLNEGE
jgi:putative effector of murein hydrolase LrgA (UPF0299 family)